MMTLEEKGAKIAGIVLGGSAVFFVVVSFYLAYHFDWTQLGSSLASLLLYGGTSALMALLCFSALRLKASHKINAALLLGSAGASIYSVELLLTIWVSLPSVQDEMEERARVNAAQQMGVPFDRRTHFEVAGDLRRQGIEAYPTSHSPALLEEQPDGSLRSKLNLGREVLPLGWISNRISVLCNESGEYVVYDSDEHGFHNPRGLWRRGGVEIAVVGDSYPHGYCVPSDRNFVALIRRRYPATLNLGMAGHGPLFMLGTIKEYAEVVKPGLVLWFYYEGNDLKNLRMEKDSPLLMRYLEGDFRQGLVDHQADIDRLLMAHIAAATDGMARKREIVEILSDPGELLGRGRDMITLSRLRRQLGVLPPIARLDWPRERRARRPEAPLDLLTKSLMRAKDSVRAWGGELHFVYLPHWHRYAEPRAAEGHRDRVLEIARAVGLNVIDVHEAFAGHPDPLGLFALRLHNHYNEAGHRVVAEAVLRSIPR
ncbi:MAG: SGNH/GDSL hydrolase family protein [Candidatus Entotheonellia bacterium]